MPLLKCEAFKKAILENPNLPLVFFCDMDIWSESHSDYHHEIWPATSISTRVGKVLSVPDNDTFGATFTDEDEDALEECIRNELNMSDEAQGVSDEEYEKMVERELKYYEPYWKECIIVNLAA